MVTSFFARGALLACALWVCAGCEPPKRAQCINDSFAGPDRWLLCQDLCAKGDDPESCAQAERLERATLKAHRQPVADTREGLKTTFERIEALTQKGRMSEASILARHLRLPEPKQWFEAHFSSEVAGRLHQGYTSEPLNLSVLPHALQNEAKAGRTNMLVHRIEDSKDERATLLQLFAIEHQTKPFKLYTVRWVADASTSGFALWSFAHHNGHFYYLGKMWEVEDPIPSERSARALRELPLTQARKLLAQNPHLMRQQISKHIPSP